MTKKNHFASTVNDGYKQTDISTYFKVTNGNPGVAAMKIEQVSINKENGKVEQASVNKENGSEKVILSPRKRPKPITSDDETDIEDAEEIINSLIGPLKASTCESSVVETPKAILKENRPRITKLPIQLPRYTYSDNSDAEERGDNITAPQPRATETIIRVKKRTKKNSEPIPTSNKKIVIKPNIDKKLERKSIIISSDEEDFEVTPTKVRKVAAPVVTGKKLSARQTAKKVKEYLASSGFSSSSSRSLNSQGKKNLGDVEPVSEFSNEPSTSRGYTIGVHKPTTVPIAAAKPKPQILQQKSKSDSSKPSTSTEFISTDFSSQTGLEVLSTSIQSVSSNDTIVYEQNINFTITGNVNSTPKKVTVLENILVNSPTKTLEQCNLSPIRKSAKTDRATTQNVSCARSLNMEDMAGATSNTVSENEIENSNWTTRLFKKIVKYVASHSHLKIMLTGNESDMLTRFFQMPQIEYQFFCFKLFTRIQKWYNIFKLRNDLQMKLSDPDMRNMYDCLFQNKFVEIDFSTDPCIELLNNLQVKDLKEICETFKIKLTNERKCEIVQKLLINCNRQTTLTMTKTTERILRDRIKQKMGICVKLSPDLYKLFNKVHLLYSFTTSDFDSPRDLHFYLSKVMNKEIFMPKINVNMDINVFSSIEQFSRFADAFECKRAMVASYEKKEIGHMLELSELAHTELKEILECYEEPKSSYMMRFTAGYKYTKTLSLGAKHLARHYPVKVEEWLIFLIEQDQYCLKQRGYWYDLLVMVQYTYLKQYEIAANTLIEALSRRDLSEVCLQELSYRAEAIKRCKTRKISELLHDRICFVQPLPLREFPFIEIDARAIRDETGRKGKRLYVKKTNQEQHIMSVEDIALEHYYEKGYANGLHCEGSLLLTIFFILFWDIIYESAIPDAFILEIQHFPLDLFSREFYTNRKADIDKRLDEIRSKWPFDQLKGFVCKMWEKHAHEKSYINDRLVNEPEELYDIILCIGRVKLAQMLERIAKNFKDYHSGLPDLFLWTVQKQQCKFVEVKGEKDKLSTKQKLWLDFLLSVGADAEVCHVHTIGSNTGRKVRKVKKEVKKAEKKESKAEKRSPNKSEYIWS